MVVEVHSFWKERRRRILDIRYHAFQWDLWGIWSKNTHDFSRGMNCEFQRILKKLLAFWEFSCIIIVMSKNISSLTKVFGSETRKWLNHFISFQVKLLEFDVSIPFLRVINSNCNSYFGIDWRKKNSESWFEFCCHKTQINKVGHHLERETLVRRKISLKSFAKVDDC